MVCQLPYRKIHAAELVRTPFLYPARHASFLRGFRANSPVGAGGPATLIVEVGPGRGDFLFHLAEANPDASIVGIEIKRKRVDKLICRVEKRGLGNVTIIQDDARVAMQRDFAEGSVSEIHVQFPDPWPKNRHEKNRSLSTDFFESCRRSLAFGGTIAILTDSESYAEAVAENASAVEGLLPIAVTQGDFDAIYPTFFSEKWRADGRRCYVRKYRKI